MTITAADYLRRAFDRYPVAWDENPFIYRTLNFSRNKVALDLDITTEETFDLTDKPFYVELSNPFLAVRRVYLVGDVYQYKLTRKPSIFEPYQINTKPLHYVLKAPQKIFLIPQQYRIDNEKLKVVYVPFLTDLNKLDDVENYLPDIVLELVALQVCIRLAENDLQYGLKAYFENEYKLLCLIYGSKGVY